MIVANKKFINLSNVAHLAAAGEAEADSLQIAVDRYYQGKDLSGCLFVMRGINSCGDLVMQSLDTSADDEQIVLTWLVTGDFTAASGALALEIVCYGDSGMILKYACTPLVVRDTVIEAYHGGVDAIEKAIAEMEKILQDAEEIAVKLPIIQGGTWWLYDAGAGAYEDSGEIAKDDKGADGADGTNGTNGQDGADGANGKDGKDGVNGADGYSPTATIAKSGNAATITITDASGTTTAIIYDGANGNDGANGTNGQDGADGYSPTITVSEDGDDIIITVVDISGTKSTTIPIISQDVSALTERVGTLETTVTGIQAQIGNISAVLDTIVEVGA